MNAEKQSNNVEDLLFEAAVQIAVHDGTDNEVFRRLLVELQSSLQSSPGTAARPPRKFAPSDATAPTPAENGWKLG